MSWHVDTSLSVITSFDIMEKLADLQTERLGLLHDLTEHAEGVKEEEEASHALGVFDAAHFNEMLALEQANEEGQPIPGWHGNKHLVRLDAFNWEGHGALENYIPIFVKDAYFLAESGRRPGYNPSPAVRRGDYGVEITHSAVIDAECGKTFYSPHGQRLASYSPSRWERSDYADPSSDVVAVDATREDAEFWTAYVHKPDGEPMFVEDFDTERQVADFVRRLATLKAD